MVAATRDALDAVAALLHHAAPAHGHVGVALRLQRFRRVVGELQEVEAADLVRAVVGTEARADAAVVDLHVEALAVVHRRAHERPHQFARRLLAVHARQRLEDGVADLQGLVAVDADPVHLAPERHLRLADDGDVVLGLAGDGATLQPMQASRSITIAQACSGLANGG
ncbi:MAG: hypothetical protein U1F25_08925 [Rubrivivax sp.]